MQLLIAGDWRWPIYEEACAEALCALGVDVIPFKTSVFFKHKFGKFQKTIPLRGPALAKLNREMLEKVLDIKPALLLVWRGTHILPSTLLKIRRNAKTKLVSYNNDDPFGPSVHGMVPWHHHFLWRLHIRSLKYYDLCLVYRKVNVREALDVGAKTVAVLKPYFIPAFHRPVSLNEEDRSKYACDICYVGHYEPDGREQYLRALVNAGLHVRLFGGKHWAPNVLGDLNDYFGEINLVYGDAYAKALCGAKMCLSFLSKLNRDTYTRRCFEIPACGQLLVCERTKDLQNIFKEDEEAVFFSSHSELVEKSSWLREHPDEVERLAEAGMRRVYADRHSVADRMKELLSIIETRL